MAGGMRDEGDDSVAAGSQAAPFRTIEHALATARGQDNGESWPERGATKQIRAAAPFSPFSRRAARSGRARGAKRHTVWRRRPLLRQGGDGGGGGFPIAARRTAKARFMARFVNAANRV